MRRRKSWRAELSAYLARQATTPFAYGRADCALFAAGAVEAICGQDPLADLDLAPYTTLKGGLRALRAAGYRAPIDLVDARLPAIPVGQARAGDLVAVRGDGGLALGIALGAWIAVKTPTGIGHLPISAAVRAWACG